MVLSRKQERRPATASEGEAAAISQEPGAGVNRRVVLGSGFAAAAMAGHLEASGAPADAHAGTRSGALATKSAHALYTLPQDYKWHTGGIYDTGQLEEWHYW